MALIKVYEKTLAKSSEKCDTFLCAVEGATMKVGKPNENRVIVRVLEAKRATDGKQKGKVVYETFESFDVYEANAAEVYKVAFEAIRKA